MYIFAYIHTNNTTHQNAFQDESAFYITVAKYLSQGTFQTDLEIRCLRDGLVRIS